MRLRASESFPRAMNSGTSNTNCFCPPCHIRQNHFFKKKNASHVQIYTIRYRFKKYGLSVRKNQKYLIKSAFLFAVPGGM